uniref:Putative cuticle protein n=1 Tax=Rhipicephalus microplus TaxID=6941 RepID=A0A6G5A7B5_RHIMP
MLYVVGNCCWGRWRARLGVAWLGHYRRRSSLCLGRRHWRACFQLLGGRISQQETGDERNFKTGSYSYQTPDGVYRTANYVADDQGFRVSIDTNEPGTKAENPADVTLNANPIEVPATAYTFGKSKS